MKGNPHPTPPRPAFGGLIRLQAHWANPITWVGPGWACLCGVIASAGFGGQGQDWLCLALLILLVDGGWGTMWAALGGTDWAKPLRRWRNWRFGEPVKPLPYTLPGSPGAQVSHWLGQLNAWWRSVLWPTCGPAISAITVAIPVIAILGALLGWELLLLSVAALAVMQLGLGWEGGQGTAAPEWDGVIAVTLPWLAGHVAFGPLTLRSAGLALAAALAWSAAWRANSPWGRLLGTGAQLLAAALLVLLHRPLAAGIVLLLLTPQLALRPWLRQGQPVPWYVGHTRPWLMAAMLIAAWAL
jgi:hypothetical protein